MFLEYIKIAFITFETLSRSTLFYSVNLLFNYIKYTIISRNLAFVQDMETTIFARASFCSFSDF